VNFQLDDFLLVECILDVDLAQLLQFDRSIALEVFPEGLLGSVRHLLRRELLACLIGVGWSMAMDDYILILKNIRVGLPIGIDENSSTPNGKLLLAGVQREGVRRVPAAELGPTPCDLDDLTHARLIAM